MKRWTIEDLARTCLDFTARGGVLAPQDDLVSTHLRSPFTDMKQATRDLRIEVHDFRQVPRPRGSRGRSHGTRRLKNVTAICWHQMAATIDEPERCLSIPVHGAVTRSGAIVLLHPMLAYMWHANAANRFTIGIEMAVRAAGIEGNPKTFWRSRREKRAGREPESLFAELTDKQRQAGLILGEYYVQEHKRQCALRDNAALNPPGIVAMGFHRNSHRSRTSDPGSAIALKIVRSLCALHRIQYGGPVVSSGAPTPAAWGGLSRVRYSARVAGFPSKPSRTV